MGRQFKALVQTDLRIDTIRRNTMIGQLDRFPLIEVPVLLRCIVRKMGLEETDREQKRLLSLPQRLEFLNGCLGDPSVGIAFVVHVSALERQPRRFFFRPTNYLVVGMALVVGEESPPRVSSNVPADRTLDPN